MTNNIDCELLFAELEAVGLIVRTGEVRNGQSVFIANSALSETQRREILARFFDQEAKQ